MSKGQKWFAAVFILLFLGFIMLRATTTTDRAYRITDTDKEENAASDGESTDFFQTAVEGAGSLVNSEEQPDLRFSDTITLWYADESLKEYLESEALSFQGEHGIKIDPVLVSGVELLEQINKASVYADEPAKEGEEKTAPPDIYITPHDNLLKAYYAGLAVPVTDAEVVVVPSNYPQTAINAVTCSDKVVGYPFYYETNYLLYNKTYMANIAKQKIEDESIPEPDEMPDGEKEVAETIEVSDEEVEEAVAALEEESDPMGDEDQTSDPQVLERLATMIPATITDITTFANNYDAPDTVEAVFKWDVTDVFYNYFFVGNYMSVGGEHGDDNTIFNIYNQQAVDCLSVYQDMNQYFSIDTKDVSYDSILQDFIDGKLVFTVATTDAIARIEQAKAEGSFEFEYGVAVLPDISTTLKARGMSVTNSVVVNGYSDKADIAMTFAHYIAYTKADNLYRKSGKIPCRKYISFDNPEISNIAAEYEKSVPLPKMVEASDFWVQLEIAFTKVWNGADPDATLKELADTIGSQIDELDYHTPVQEAITVGM
ncbi:MAG: sugar ABC transporter substrate-binding protein [Lachnospiraceae bacterium]|nr:sugar ABC transporter substrate-binding protein [Lachnospiraceae bacterium]